MTSKNGGDASPAFLTASVAQLVERLPVKQEAIGSSPIRGVGSIIIRLDSA